MSEVGKNLRKERKSRGITIKQLAEMIELAGGSEVSESLISMWENGKRKMYAEQMYYVCLALNISPMTLFGQNSDAEIDSRLRGEISFLPDDEKQIFYHMFYKWSGNPRALVRFIGLYMSLPRQLRLDIAGMGLTVYKLGLESGKLDKSAPPVDYDYLQDAWGKLMK